MKLVLASTSPFRRELLAKLGLDEEGDERGERGDGGGREEGAADG